MCGAVNFLSSSIFSERNGYMKNSAVKFISCAAAAAMILSSLPRVYAKTLAEKLEYEDDASVSDILFDTYYYSDYIEDNAGYGSVSGARADIDITAFVSEGEKPEIREDAEKGKCVYWGENCSALSFEVEIPEKGFYEMHIEYFAADGNLQNISRGIKIDGDYPFEESKNIFLRRFYKDSGEPLTNSLGDEVMPSQNEIKKWTDTAVYDNQGLYSEPLRFALEKGKHTVTFLYINQPVLISAVYFTAPEDIPEYSEVLKEYEENGYKNAEDKMEFEAEDFDHVESKTASSILIGSDSDETITPKSVTKKRYNYIGGSSWASGGDSITWNFTVKESGLYKLALRTVQNANSGMPSFRKIEIDGKVPFAELKEYRFEYSSVWSTDEISNGDEPYLFYLEEGKHTLTMTAQNGGMTEIIEKISEANSRLSNCYQNIVMVTGQSPDLNYDYELDKSIASLYSDLDGVVSCLDDCITMLKEITNETATLENSIKQVKTTFEEYRDDPDSIPAGLSDFTSALTSMGDWLTTAKTQLLYVDKIIFVSPETELPNPKQTIWNRIVNTVMNLIISYTKDYNAVGSLGEENEGGKELEVWISKSKEWAETLKELADSGFAMKNNVRLKVNLLPEGAFSGVVNTLLLSINAGNSPDVVLNMTPNMAAEYAVRGALYDISSFSDFEETADITLEEMFKPLTYDGKVYGFPETMDFRVMFYRTDIFEKLHIDVPDTWDDVYEDMLPKLYQYNLQMYVPANFSIFLWQNGGQFYTDDCKQSALDSEEAVRAFEQFIGNYNDYGFPYNVSFYNRFRTGELPVGIGGLSDYMSISYAAPELSGKWAIAPIPAQVNEDGTKNRSVGGLITTASIILQDTKEPELAWEFIKWWMSTDTQVEYGQRIESLLGISARWATANTEAFRRLPWSTDDLKVISSCWDWIKENPYVLGGYFTDRHINNAIARCITGGETPRSSLEEAYEQINIELERKRADFGIED